MTFDLPKTSNKENSSYYPNKQNKHLSKDKPLKDVITLIESLEKKTAEKCDEEVKKVNYASN